MGLTNSTTTSEEMETSGEDRITPADTRPAVTRGVEFNECLVFTIRAEWGHFRRVDGNIIKQTYRVMPRTTVAGLCAAICGCPRDTYYDAFSPDSSAMAIEPLGDLRTMNIPVNALSTAKGDFKSEHGHHSWPIPGLKIADPTSKRQQHNYEVLVDPAYRIYIWQAGDLYDTLQSHLEEGTSIYTTCLGLSEYLASVTYEGTRDVTHTLASDQTDPVVTGAVPRGPRYVSPNPGMRSTTERSPGFMERVPNTPHARRTTGFVNWTVSSTGDDLAVTKETPISSVNGIDQVVFM